MAAPSLHLWDGTILSGLVGSTVFLQSSANGKYVNQANDRPWWGSVAVHANSASGVGDSSATWVLSAADSFSMGSISGWYVTLTNQANGGVLGPLSGVNCMTAGGSTVSWQRAGLVTSGLSTGQVAIYAVARPGYDGYDGYNNAYQPAGSDGLFSGTDVGTYPVSGNYIFSLYLYY